MTLPRIAALLGLSLAATRGVQLPNGPSPSEVCAEYAHIEVPAADLPTAADRERLMGCDSERLYFGFDRPAQVVDARKCAHLQWQAVTVDKGKFFPPTAILMMIYANGRGAARNLDLAMKYSCRIGGAADAEITGRIEHLERLKKQGWTGREFHICDDFTSGLMWGLCTGFREEFNSVGRQRRFDTLLSDWLPAEKDAWRELQKAADEFFAASAANEEDLSGTGRNAFEIGARAELADGLVKALEEFEHGALPQSAPDEFKSADAKLNARYRQLQAHKFESGSVKFNGIQTAQRAWLRYREAWVQFGKIRYPSVPADSWRTWLTRERIAMWKDIDRQ